MWCQKRPRKPSSRHTKATSKVPQKLAVALPSFLGLPWRLRRFWGFDRDGGHRGCSVPSSAVGANENPGKQKLLPGLSGVFDRWERQSTVVLGVENWSQLMSEAIFYIDDTRYSWWMDYIAIVTFINSVITIMVFCVVCIPKFRVLLYGDTTLSNMSNSYLQCTVSYYSVRLNQSRAEFYSIHSKEPGPHHPSASHSFSSAPFFKWLKHKLGQTCRKEVKAATVFHQSVP